MSDVRAQLERELGPRGVGTLALPGALALPLVTPASEEQLCGLLARAAREGWRVLPLGLGGALARRAGIVADLALSTRALTGIVEYEPGEGVITARAGTTLDVLRHATWRERHWLTPYLAHESRATLGGTLSEGRSGLDRARFGPLRHHVLGLRVALFDGTRTKSGGRLVKNVTGFDMHRLYTGARGSLCVLLEASLRLFPAPRALACARCALAAPAQARALVDAAWSGALAPLVLALARDERGAWELALLLGGAPTVLEQELALVARLLPALEFERDAAALLALRQFADASAPRPEHAALECAPSALFARLEALATHPGRVLALPNVATLALDVAPPGARSDERAPLQRELERRLKQALDPRGVLAEA